MEEKKENLARQSNEVTAIKRELDEQMIEIKSQLDTWRHKWRQLADKHNELGIRICRTWEATQLEINAAGSSLPAPYPHPLFTRDRASKVKQQLIQTAPRILERGKVLLTRCRKIAAEQAIAKPFPWPVWPKKISTLDRLKQDLSDLKNLLEQIAAAQRLMSQLSDELHSWLHTPYSALADAEGAQQALVESDQEVATSIERGRSQPTDQLSVVIHDLKAQIRKLEYWDFYLRQCGDTYRSVLAQTLKYRDKLAIEPLETGRSIQEMYNELERERIRVGERLDVANNNLRNLSGQWTQLEAENADWDQQIALAEQESLRTVNKATDHEIKRLTKPISQLDEVHNKVFARIAANQQWLAALARFEENQVKKRMQAVDRLCKDIEELVTKGERRIEEIDKARTTILWPPSKSIPKNGQYLIPVWVLRYRPWGRGCRPKIRTLTLGSVQIIPSPRGLSPAPGLQIEQIPALAACLKEHLAAVSAERLAKPLEGDNLLAIRRELRARWQKYAANGLIAPWIRYLL
jgi:hypothetical protein